MIALLIILLLISLVWMRRQYQANVTLKFQFQLYALRDRLRNGVISGEIDRDDPVFNLLDKGISHTIDQLPDFSLWSMSASMFFNAIRPKQPTPSPTFLPEVKDNPLASDIYHQMGLLMAHCTVQKHKYSLVALFAALLPVLGLADVYASIEHKTQNQIFSFRDQGMAGLC